MPTDVELQPLTTVHAVIISEWLQGNEGIETLRLLGNIVPDNFTTNASIERTRIEEILTDKNKQAWIVLFDDEPVGVAEVDLSKIAEMKAPHISFFIGDKNNRGNGIGFSALNLIIQKLGAQGYKTIYGRVLTRNSASQKVMQKCGFTTDGAVYTDTDGLLWQNYKLK